MKISQVKISNFRSYKHETVVDFKDLTVFVGKNDIGKSTVLEALDIFFNDGDGVVKLDKEDINKQGVKEGNTDIVITVVFEDLPLNVVIDSANKTTLKDEYLLNNQGNLEITKVYPNAGKGKVYIKANHPSNKNCSDLLLKKQKDLQKIIKDKSITCSNEKKNATMRAAIWEYYSDDLQLQETKIDTSKEDAKNIWDQLKSYMPLYSLFQSDRKNNDEDEEVQNPMKLAVKQILKDEVIQNNFKEVALKVNEKLKEVANQTLDKLKEMDPEVTKSLKPVIPSAEKLKWETVFKDVSISGDEDISINKRGSGVKRLVLLNFFRAEAERRKNEKNVPDIIYAIEEPETSQHPNYERKITEAFIELSKGDHAQIILTTHSPAIVKMLDFEHLKLIKGDNPKEIIDIERSNLPYPSLNEVNFLAFDESDEGYHSELFGYIEGEGWFDDYRKGKKELSYIEVGKDGKEDKKYPVILSKYIRHQIHHPENKKNKPYTRQQLKESIGQMREFIVQKNKEDGEVNG